MSRNTNGCYPPHCKVKDTAYILGKRPPCITGLWKGSSLRLRKTTRNQIEGPCNLEFNPLEIRFSQNNRFVTGIRIRDGKPEKDELIGVWEPQIIGEKVVSWNLWLVDFDDSGKFFLSVLKKGKGNRVEKMITTYIEAGFSPTNKEQVPTAQQGILTRIR